MVDYKIDNQFKADRTSWGSFKTVDGLAEFEQTLVVVLHNEMQEIIGQKITNPIEKIKLKINRIAKLFGVVEEIRSIRVGKSATESGTYEVVVTYSTGQPFSEVF
jgi:hypothetical protein